MVALLNLFGPKTLRQRARCSVSFMSEGSQGYKSPLEYPHKGQWKAGHILKCHYLFNWLNLTHVPGSTLNGLLREYKTLEFKKTESHTKTAAAAAAGSRLQLCLTLCATPQTAAHQAPSLLSRQNTGGYSFLLHIQRLAKILSEAVTKSAAGQNHLFICSSGCQLFTMNAVSV